MSDIQKSINESPEPNECTICNVPQVPDDIFKAGFQDPQNKRVALVMVCRTCFVVQTGPPLRTALDKQWYG